MFNPLQQPTAAMYAYSGCYCQLTVQSVKDFAKVLVTSFKNIVFMFTSSAPLYMFFWDEGVASSVRHD